MSGEETFVKTIGDILDGVNRISLASGERDLPIRDITYDSRQVKPGTLFVALRGDRFDGHRFVDAAVEAGAAAVLVEKNSLHSLAIDSATTVLTCDDTRAVLAPLGCVFFGYPARKMVVIGITGTNGKTSTTYLLEAIFQAAEVATGVIGTVEYRWGNKVLSAPNTTPDGLILQRTLRAMADDGVDVVILEVSSHALESGRVDGLDFDRAVFTNLSQDHLDFHPTMRAYRDAKRRLFFDVLPRSMTHDGELPVAVINVDDPEGRQLEGILRRREDLRVKSFGIVDSDADIRGTVLRLDVEGVHLAVTAESGDSYELSAALPGHFNAENILSAAVTAQSLGVDVQAVMKGLREFSGIPGRMQRVQSTPGEGPAVFVDYAHTPDALERALTTLRPLTDGKLWVVFGCGGDRDRSKRALMGEVAVCHADQLVLTSDNPRSEPPEAIIDAIEAGVVAACEARDLQDRGLLREADRQAAIAVAVGRASADDVILIAGKGHETTQEIAGELRPFDDREVAADALRRRGEC